MARKVRKPKPSYYGPEYNARGDARSPVRSVNDGTPGQPGGTGVYKGGKTKTVLRDPLDYYRANKKSRRV